MNCFSITTSHRQTKIRVAHIFQTHDELVHLVNIAFSEVTVNDHIMTFSDLFVIQKFYFSLCEIFQKMQKIQFRLQ